MEGTSQKDDTITLRVLASGSSGNSLFVRVGDTRLLIDAGVSCRRVERGLEEIGESVGALDAVLVTHEHSDHVKGLRVLLSKHPELPVFASRGTMKGCEERFETPACWTPIVADDLFRIGEITIDPFELLHDADEPTGFRLDAAGFSLGLATDLGFWTDEIAERLAGCRILLVEANHDVHMLRNGPYPAFLKRRVASSDGHLSNDQARALVSRIAGPDLEWLILIHLSQKNNAADLAVEEVSRGVLDRSNAQVIAAGKGPGEAIELAPKQATVSAPVRQGVLF
jgi:phosphoribosyl 1,2-cyclic phosphodiesterase